MRRVGGQSTSARNNIFISSSTSPSSSEEFKTPPTSAGDETPVRTTHRGVTTRRRQHQQQQQQHQQDVDEIPLPESLDQEGLRAPRLSDQVRAIQRRHLLDEAHLERLRSTSVQIDTIRSLPQQTLQTNIPEVLQDGIDMQFNLACHEWKRTLVGTVHNLGVLISMPLMGYVSDRWGRRKAIILSGLCLATGALKTLAGSGHDAYLTYIIIEFFEAVLVTGTYTTCFVLIVELIGSDKRTLGSAAVGISVAVGELILNLIVWNVPYWRHFLLIVSLPAPLFLAYTYLLEESMRWLLTNGNNEEAVVLLHKIASWNKFAVSDKVIDEITKESKDLQNIVTEKFNIKLLFSSSALLKRVLVCSWWWFTAAFVYYGLMINSINLPGNKYTNFALSSLATIPGDVIAVITLDRLGRKKTLLGGFVFCGICCVSSGFIPPGYNSASIAVFLIGKTSISACFNAVYVYTSELVPTSARGSLVGTCSMLARVGTVLAPLTPLLSELWHSLPTAVFGLASLSAAALTLATPETLNRRLPDSVAEATAIS
ncbi:organic cation transporter protein-like [Bicyclus anynana]|uniref:Organic cation transporter protein-like n=1 Tax=Bicyclus anynana TaxID=110368 RepID=A0ABM3LPZ0_BICAN|nr:organic cation transporter protein-like [Bicyclus anynana]